MDNKLGNKIETSSSQGAGGPCVARTGPSSCTPENWSCPICMDLLYKPCVNNCGHTFCFWCMHHSMNPFRPSQCPLCRAAYTHFPRVCVPLHYFLASTFPDKYAERERENKELEAQQLVESPDIPLSPAMSAIAGSEPAPQPTQPGQEPAQACAAAAEGDPDGSPIPDCIDTTTAAVHDNAAAITQPGLTLSSSSSSSSSSSLSPSAAAGAAAAVTAAVKAGPPSSVSAAVPGSAAVVAGAPVAAACTTPCARAAVGSGDVPYTSADADADVDVARPYRCRNPACNRLACPPCVLSCGCLVCRSCAAGRAATPTSVDEAAASRGYLLRPLSSPPSAQPECPANEKSPTEGQDQDQDRAHEVRQQQQQPGQQEEQRCATALTSSLAPAATAAAAPPSSATGTVLGCRSASSAPTCPSCGLTYTANPRVCGKLEEALRCLYPDRYRRREEECAAAAAAAAAAVAAAAAAAAAACGCSDGGSCVGGSKGVVESDGSSSSSCSSGGGGHPLKFGHPLNAPGDPTGAQEPGAPPGALSQPSVDGGGGSGGSSSGRGGGLGRAGGSSSTGGRTGSGRWERPRSKLPRIDALIAAAAAASAGPGPGPGPGPPSGAATLSAAARPPTISDIWLALRAEMAANADSCFTWYSVGCDDCGVFPIIGRRYRCQDCTELIGYDLCGACYDRGTAGRGRFNQVHGPGHRMAKVEPCFGNATRGAAARRRMATAAATAAGAGRAEPADGGAADGTSAPAASAADGGSGGGGGSNVAAVEAAAMAGSGLGVALEGVHLLTLMNYLEVLHPELTVEQATTLVILQLGRATMMGTSENWSMVRPMFRARGSDGLGGSGSSAGGGSGAGGGGGSGGGGARAYFLSSRRRAFTFSRDGVGVAAAAAGGAAAAAAAAGASSAPGRSGSSSGGGGSARGWSWLNWASRLRSSRSGGGGGAFGGGGEGGGPGPRQGGPNGVSRGGARVHLGEAIQPRESRVRDAGASTAVRGTSAAAVLTPRRSRRLGGGGGGDGEAGGGSTNGGCVIQ